MARAFQGGRDIELNVGAFHETPLRKMNRMKRLLLLLFLVPIAVACSGSPATPTAATSSQDLQVIVANSTHVIGANRFPVGVIRDGRSVKDAQVQLKFFDITSGDPVAKGETIAPYFGDNLGEAGVYVGHTDFDKAGSWGVEATVTETGFAPETKRIGFKVPAQDPAPGIGEDAPRSKNLTLKDVNGDRTKISSSDEDDSILHQISIADAVTNGKPTVILFATPRFCTSRTCGPSHQVVLSLAKNYADRVNFIHVEVTRISRRSNLPTRWRNGV